MLDSVRYLWAMLCGNLKTSMANRKQVFFFAVFMFLQNAMFFVLWALLFKTASNLNGWGLTDVARMYGIIGGVVGLTLFLFSGVRSIARRVLDGSLDAYIIRPRSALPAIMLSESAPAALGDLVFAITILATLGGVGWDEVPMFVLLIFMATIIFLSACTVIYSLAFWLKGNTRFSDQMFEMLIIVSANVIHGQPFGVKLIAFTVLPAGFISYLPVELIREFDWNIFIVLFAATVFYAGLAHFVFKAGLKQYVRAED